MSEPKEMTMEMIHTRAIRLSACERAFESPDGRTIATENIPEGLVWRLIAALECFTYAANSGELAKAEIDARILMNSLKIEEDHDRQP